MTGKLHRILAAGAAVASAFALFACFVAYMDKSEAMKLFCRFTPALDCYRSLTEFASTLALGPVAVVPFLAAAALLQVALAGAAFATAGARRDGLLAWAAVASFPLAGLAVTLLLNDIMAAKATTVAALYLVAFGGWGCAIAFLRRKALVPALRAGAGGAALLALLAVGGGMLLEGAGTLRLSEQELAGTADARPPVVRWPRFAPEVPRERAPSIGPSDAETEVLLFLDLSSYDSRQVLRGALADRPRYERHAMRVVVLAAPPHDAALAVAEAAGVSDAYFERLFRKSDEDARTILESVRGDPGRLDDPELRTILDRRIRAIEALKLPALPCALSAKGVHTGEKLLGQILPPSR